MIWAEENAALAASTYEWAYGNGANMPNNAGVVVYVPPGFSAELVAMGMSIQTGSATVEAVISGVEQGATAIISLTSPAETGLQMLSTPAAVVDGDFLNFKTRSATSTSGPHLVSMHIRVFK